MSPADEPVPGAEPENETVTEPEELAPAVVIVMVAHNPGPWWEDGLASIAQQRYANLAVFVVDTASDDDLTPRLAAVLPDAHLRRLDHNAGFGPAANEAIEAIE